MTITQAGREILNTELDTAELEATMGSMVMQIIVLQQMPIKSTFRGLELIVGKEGPSRGKYTVQLHKIVQGPLPVLVGNFKAVRLEA